MYTSKKPHTVLIIPTGMVALNDTQKAAIRGGKRREGALAWRMGPALFASPLLGPVALFLGLL